MNQNENGITKIGCVNHDCAVCKAKAQRQWVGLTPEQRKSIAEENNMLVDDDLFDTIESKLREKNT